MSTTQKLELSREIRQWIGTILGLGSTAIFIWMMVDPEGFNKAVKKFQKKLSKKHEKKDDNVIIFPSK